MSLITFPNNEARVARFELLRSQETLVTVAGVTQVTSFPDARWALSLEIVQQKSADLRAWSLALTRLSDKAHWFAYGPPHYSGPSTGYAGSAPSVSGAGQLGTALTVDGLPNSTAILLAGDFISFDTVSNAGNANRQLIQVYNNVTSDGDGVATMSLASPIRQAPADDATVNISTPTALFMLVESRGGVNFDVRRSSEFFIDAIERIFA